MSRRNYWTTLRQRKISRRTMLGASAKAGVGAAGLALVGCGDDDDDAAPAAVDTSAIDAAAGDASAAASAAGEASAAASEASAAASEAAAAASQAAEAAAQAARDAAAAVEAGTATAAAAQAAINAAAEAAAAAAAAAGEASAAAGAAAATAAETAEAAPATAAAAVAAAQEATEAAGEAASAAAAAVAGGMAETDEFSVPWPLDQVDLDASIVTARADDSGGVDQQRNGSFTNYHSHAAVFNAAMERDPRDANPIPSLAAPEWIDRVTVRASVVPAPFHDGSILTAHDLVFSYDRMGALAEYHDGGATTDHPGGWAPSNPARSAESWVRNEAVDDRTWAFELAGPDAAFFIINLAGVGEVAILSQADTERRGDLAVDQSAMGTGPYRFVSHTDDEDFVFERFEDHFLPIDHPVRVPHYAHNKHLTVLVRPEIQSRLAGIEAGEIDMLDALGPDIVQPFLDDPDFAVQFQPPGPWAVHNIYPNLFAETMADGSPNPFLDLRVRRAANHAVNRQAIIDNLLLGVGEQALFAFSGVQGYPSPEQKQEVIYDYDPERARQLLAEAGYPDGFDIPLYWTPEWGGSYATDFALAVSQDLTAAGIRVQTESALFTDFLTDAYLRGGPDRPAGLYWFWGNTVPDVGSMWNCCAGPESSFTRLNGEGVQDPALHELFLAQKVELDPERRLAMIAELFLEHARQAYFIFLVEPPDGVLTRSDVNWPKGGRFGALSGGSTYAAQKHI